MASGKEPEIGVRLNVDGFVSNAKKAQKAGGDIGNIDLSGLKDKINSIGGGFKSLGTTILGVFGGNLLTGAVSKLASGLGKMSGMVADGFKDAMEDSRIKERAEQVFGPENFGFLDEVSEKMKSAFGFDDGDSRKAMITLGEMGMSAEKSAKSMSLAADIARAKEMSIGDAARLVGLAYQGNAKAAKALGLEVQKTGDPIKDQANLIEQMQKKFGGAAGAYAKNLPPLEKAKVAIADMIKAIAAKLIPVVVPFLQWVSNSLTGIANSEGFASFVESFVSVFKTVWAFAQKIGVTLVTYGLAFFDIVKQLPAALGNMWNSGKLMEWVITMIGGVLKTLMDAVVLLGQYLWNAYTQAVPGAIAFLAKALIDALRAVLGEFISNKLGLGKASEFLNKTGKDAFSSFGDNMKTAMSEFGGKAKENFGSMGDISKDMFKGAGLDMGASMDRARGTANGLFGMGEGTKNKIAQDTRDLYNMTGKANDTIGFSAIGKKNALLKNKKKLRQGVDKANKKARGGLRINLNLQSADRINPIMTTT